MELLVPELEGLVSIYLPHSLTLPPSPPSNSQVELLVPELEGLSEEGAQQLVWNSARLFLDSLKEELNYEVGLGLKEGEERGSRTRRMGERYIGG